MMAELYENNGKEKMEVVNGGSIKQKLSVGSVMRRSHANQNRNMILQKMDCNI